jgi:putative tryptophan/tyrosine transport system substrate-binding protein
MIDFIGDALFGSNQNQAIEYRWAGGDFNRLPELAADLVRRRVTVMAIPNAPAALAAKTATTTIPIIFYTGADPIQIGLVASLNRPGGNVTGVSWFSAELGPKRLELLHDLIPTAKTIALLVNPNSAESPRQAIELQDAARTLGLRLIVLNVTTPGAIDTAFETIKQDRIDALVVAGDPFLANRREQILALATRDAIPAVYVNREMAGADGLMSYGNSLLDAYRRAGLYTARILKGEKPTDLPVDQAIRFELVINLKTAKALGLTVPETLLATADEVIQ